MSQPSSLMLGPSRRSLWWKKCQLQNEERPEWTIPRTEDSLLSESLKKTLCERCRSVHWPTLAPIEVSFPYVLHRLQESSIPLEQSSCYICQFFARIWTSPYSHPSQTKPRGLSRAPQFSLAPVAHLRHSRIYASFISHYYHGTVGLIIPDGKHAALVPRIIDPQSIDYGVLRGWFNTCRQYHASTCRPERAMSTLGFKVIDCELGRVVSAPERCKFVALSYVWGRSASIADIDHTTRFPRTIEDSIKVTKEMGFKYLWVDRYCIEQEDFADKHRQLRRMDEIYSQARLTIIAAAGPDPTYGLPGVGLRHRIPQQRLDIEGITFVQIKYPPRDFDLLPWASRAWTYQEGLLSRRKLIFTDYGVFFVCNAMHGAECVQAAGNRLDPGPFSDMIRLHDRLPYETLIKEYTARTMSYDSDALNACMGILKAKGLVHLWGIKTKLHRTKTASYQTLSLGFLLHEPSRRRVGFPSWSWAGWAGSVSFLNDMVVDQECVIRIGDGRSDWQDLKEYVSSGRAERDAGDPDAPRFLQMSGPALVSPFSEARLAQLRPYQRANEQSKNETRRFSIPLPLAPATGIYMEPIACLDELLESNEQLRDCIAMPIWCNDEDSYLSALLLKPDRVEQVYKRIGVVLLGAYDYWDWGHGKERKSAVVKVSELWLPHAEVRTVVVG